MIESDQRGVEASRKPSRGEARQRDEEAVEDEGWARVEEVNQQQEEEAAKGVKNGSWTWG